MSGTPGGTARTESEMSDHWTGFDPVYAAFNLEHISEDDRRSVTEALAAVRRETAMRCAEMMKEMAKAVVVGDRYALGVNRYNMGLADGLDRGAAAITKEFGL